MDTPATSRKRPASLLLNAKAHQPTASVVSISPSLAWRRLALGPHPPTDNDFMPGRKSVFVREIVASLRFVLRLRLQKEGRICGTLWYIIFNWWGYQTSFSPLGDLGMSYHSAMSRHYESSISGAGDVWVTLRNTTYRNNSYVMIEEIGEHDDALLCMTNLTQTNSSIAFGDWFFPNGTVIPSDSENNQSDIYGSRGQMVVRMHRRRGGEEGIYCCMIPDTMNVTQTIYIGVYSISTGE